MLLLKLVHHGYTTAATLEHISAQACGLFLEKRHCRGSGLTHYVTPQDAAAFVATSSILVGCGSPICWKATVTSGQF